MSVERSVYAIYGFDLTKQRNKIVTEEFRNSQLYEDFTDHYSVGNIQLFLDPMSGKNLYFGYIVAIFDDYSDGTFKMDPETMWTMQDKIFDEALKLCPDINLPYREFIVFTEWY